MGYFRKHLFSLAFVVLAAFLAVLTAESFHHHERAGTKEQDCSLCSWQLTSSNATATPVPFFFFYPLLAVFLFTFKPLTLASVSIAPSGRSPPQNLL